jgi:hypothetical protein
LFIGFEFSLGRQNDRYRGRLAEKWMAERQFLEADSNSRRTERASAAWGKWQLALLAVRKPIIRLPFLA